MSLSFDGIVRRDDTGSDAVIGALKADFMRSTEERGVVVVVVDDDDDDDVVVVDGIVIMLGSRSASAAMVTRSMMDLICAEL